MENLQRNPNLDADTLSIFFAEVAQRVQDKEGPVNNIQSQIDSLSTTIIAKTTRPMFFFPTSQVEVFNRIRSLKNSHSADFDTVFLQSFERLC